MGTGSTDDAELWSAALGGDGGAFTDLFIQHRDRVFRHAARLVDSSADADDVAATAFFELWRRQAAVTLVDGSPLPWLLVATTNIARNARRGTTRYRAVLDRLPRSTDLEDPAEQALGRVEGQRGEREAGSPVSARASGAPSPTPMRARSP